MQLSRDGQSIVAYTNCDCLWGRLWGGSEVNLDCSGVGRILDGIADQVDEDLAQQVQIANQQANAATGPGGAIMLSAYQGNTQNNTPPIDRIKVSLDLLSFEEIAGVAILLVLISSTISIIYITKYEPMKILAERN